MVLCGCKCMVVCSVAAVQHARGRGVCINYLPPCSLTGIHSGPGIRSSEVSKLPRSAFAVDVPRAHSQTGSTSDVGRSQ